uniref:Uncharacterized protein n=1 Tax=Magallana gigas TaxID=29159 RepID=A0A8W8IK97_MAGGI
MKLAEAKGIAEAEKRTHQLILRILANPDLSFSGIRRKLQGTPKINHPKQGWILRATSVKNQATSHISVQRDGILLGWQSTGKDLRITVIQASALHLLQ